MHMQRLPRYFLHTYHFLLASRRPDLKIKYKMIPVDGELDPVTKHHFVLMWICRGVPWQCSDRPIVPAPDDRRDNRGLMAWRLAGKLEVYREILPKCHFVHLYRLLENWTQASAVRDRPPNRLSYGSHINWRESSSELSDNPDKWSKR
jgi:hypothetical protein